MAQDEKICPQCATAKPLTDFYKCGGKPGSWCKSCADRKSAEWRAKNPARYRASQRIRNARGRVCDPERHRRYAVEFKQRTPKYWSHVSPGSANARRIIHRALKSGKIIRPERCSLCATPCKPDAHHENYSLPLAVVWLCKKCHGMTTRVDNPLIVAVL